MELDLYWKWLGIPPVQQPANHYTLLGIARFGTDEDVIENAAVRQMTHVRSFQGGQHVALSQQLLNELSTARLCLLNDEQKRVYNQQLQDQIREEQAVREEEVREMYRTLGRASGLDVDAMEAEIAADRARQEARRERLLEAAGIPSRTQAEADPETPAE